MLHNDVAQQRPGEKPASAPKTSQKSPRAQGQAKFKIQTLNGAGSQHEDIDDAGLKDGNIETTNIIYIHGRHSPLTRVQLMTPATMRMLQHPQSLTKILQHKPMLLPQPARNHSFGKGHVHARSVLRPEHGTEQQQLPQQETEDLQQNLERSKHAQKLAGLDTRMHLHSHTDSDTHSMHSAPPAAQQPQEDRESLQNAPKEKNEQAASASWSARYHPFGEGHGQTSTVLGPVQGSKQHMQTFAMQEIQWQNLHRERAAAPHSQIWAQQKKSETSRPPHSISPAPRRHPMGGSFTQQEQIDKKKANPIQETQGEGTRVNTAEQVHVGPLADGCGRMAEFLAPAPWDERRVDLEAYNHTGSLRLF